MKKTREEKQLIQQKKAVVNHLPSLKEIIRGSYLKRYLKCSYPQCKCHKSKKYLHGPYYSISIRKKDKSYHIYVPLEKRKEVNRWIKNYNLLWQGIEDISSINAKLIRLDNKKPK